jgi:hypothetical protein
MREERLLRGDMRSRPEQYEETVHPSNPPQSTKTAPAVIAGLWYYLAPLALVILLITFALIYWEARNNIQQPPAEPTLGVVDDAKPGGHDPNPKPRTTEDELDFRGDR